MEGGTSGERGPMKEGEQWREGSGGVIPCVWSNLWCLLCHF